MRLIFSLCVSLISVVLFAQQSTDSLLHQLDVTIEKREVYLKEKFATIDKLKGQSRYLKGEALFNQYVKIYDEYKSFIYDSAFRYARKMQSAAYQSHDQQNIASARIKLGFVLVSSGLFTEAIDTLRKVESEKLTDSAKVDFFYLMARTCYDLCDFNRDDFYSVRYAERGHAYVDSALSLMSPQSAQYYLMYGIKNVRQQNMREAQTAFEKMIGDFDLNDGDFAVAASTLSFIYLFSNEPVKAKEMLIRAAIADIRFCTKETLATLNLADMLYKEGDIENAYKYVKIALEDANFYGARHRKVQVAAVFPIIEGQQLSMVESKRKMLLLYATVITILSVLLIVLAIVIYKQFKNLQTAKKIISEANDSLTEINHQLFDANKIKEEYIWYYFTTTAEYITKLDALKKTLDLKLMTKKIDDLRFTVDSINIKKERDDLYHNFDSVFLKLFPGFVTTFNSFFKEEDRIVLKDGQLLNTELRIFALVRMGISDHEKIAKILDYSVTTIYTYKTRIRNKSTLPNEEFEKQIMAIRAI
jgi:tetratricopeptide (TPR) repeat protein